MTPRATTPTLAAPKPEANLNTVTVALANVSVHVGRPDGDDDPDHYLMAFHDAAKGILVTVGFDEQTLRRFAESIVEHTSPIARVPKPKLHVASPGVKL